jgi:hypothetical protein
MKWKKRYSSEHLCAEDLDGKEVTVEIQSIMTIDVPGDEGKKRPEVAFRGAKKKWIANVSAGACLAAMFGEDDDGWIGKRVTLHSQPTHMKGEMVDGIAVKGSPDIAKQITFRARIGRQKKTFRLVPTGKPSAAQRQAEPEPPPDLEPGLDDRSSDMEGF